MANYMKAVQGTFVVNRTPMGSELVVIITDIRFKCVKWEAGKCADVREILPEGSCPEGYQLAADLVLQFGSVECIWGMSGMALPYVLEPYVSKLYRAGKKMRNVYTQMSCSYDGQGHDFRLEYAGDVCR